MGVEERLPEAGAARGLGFPKASRLLTKADFDRVYQRRCKASDGLLLVFAADNTLEHPRLGLSISRKAGNAVVRNRLKRWLREAFRLQQHDLPRRIDLVAIVVAPERANLLACQQSLRRLSAKLARRLHEQRDRAPDASPTAETTP